LKRAGASIPAGNCLVRDNIHLRSRLPGTFYGPGAEETGGTIAIENDNGQVALGVFFTPSGD